MEEYIIFLENLSFYLFQNWWKRLVASRDIVHMTCASASSLLPTFRSMVGTHLFFFSLIKGSLVNINTVGTTSRALPSQYQVIHALDTWLLEHPVRRPYVYPPCDRLEQLGMACQDQYFPLANELLLLALLVSCMWFPNLYFDAIYLKCLSTLFYVSFFSLCSLLLKP